KRGDPRHIRQRFLRRVPNRLIAWRTIQTPPGFPHAAEYQRVTTRVELEPAGSGTRVRLSGIGYPAGAAGDALLGFFREGNRSTLEQLRARFVTGPVDWAARQAAAK
ncbi:MAG TPA: SRPBCC domain-containing protein, partial [Allosphingosinicella sp.]|nr:SRPBCC domain-containing protein [Allosphingosinicella sp.]